MHALKKRHIRKRAMDGARAVTGRRKRPMRPSFLCRRFFLERNAERNADNHAFCRKKIERGEFFNENFLRRGGSWKNGRVYGKHTLDED